MLGWMEMMALRTWATLRVLRDDGDQFWLSITREIDDVEC